ncbi:MAG: DUF4260 domain-containing protein [Rhizobiales bacterium]|jgi:hypothetical protein|nr:DUF4260 domain-containing protein [Hyphomicrobiales bacterium]
MNAPVSAVAGLPRMLLKAEGFALFAICVFAYWKLGVTWWLFAVLILAPDLTMIGYLAGPRFGAHLYNAGHITVMPLILGFAGLYTDSVVAMAAALVWLAHIGIDRMLGFGLKFETAFSDTHLGRIGKS